MSEARAAFRRARRCYGHLAGEAGVALRQWLEAADLLQVENGAYRLTAAGRAWAQALGLDGDDRDPARHARCCLDGTERVFHVGGRLGRSLLERLVECGAVRNGEGRTLVVTDAAQLRSALALPPATAT